MASEIEELVKLLENASVNNDVKDKGLEYILGLTASEDGLKTLLTNTFTEYLLSSMNKPSSENGDLSLQHKVLINISASKEGAFKLLSFQENLVLLLLQKICQSSYNYVEQVCYVLNNLTCHGDVWDEEKTQGVLGNHIIELTDHFLSINKEKYKFLPLVFANLTKHASGRKYFLENVKVLLEVFRILTYPAEAVSVVSRLGVSLMLKNCCFETNKHERLLKQLDVLPCLLLPLMGPEEYDEEEVEKLPEECQFLLPNKNREAHPKIRRNLVQALCLLCYSELGWNHLKDNGVFYITKKLHNWEKDDLVIEAIETLLLYMMVENYHSPSDNRKESILESIHTSALETDTIKDLPDFVI